MEKLRSGDACGVNRKCLANTSISSGLNKEVTVLFFNLSLYLFRKGYTPIGNGGELQSGKICIGIFGETLPLLSLIMIIVLNVVVNHLHSHLVESPKGACYTGFIVFSSRGASGFRQ
jgi:hypothetical protein